MKSALPLTAHTRALPVALRARVSRHGSRRELLSGLGGATILGLGAASAEAVTRETACSSSSSPAATSVTCVRFGYNSDGRLLGCKSDENCISSSAVNSATQFGPPYGYKGDPEEAWSRLVSAVKGSTGLTIVEQDDQLQYLRAEGASLVPPTGIDDVEFLLRSSDSTVFYRSASRETVFVYPLQQPVGDRNNNKNRVEGIFANLGWQKLGYEGDDLFSPDSKYDEEISRGGFFGRFLGNVFDQGYD